MELNKSKIMPFCDALKTTFFVIFVLIINFKNINIMSKTIDLQIEKSRVLIDGLRKNIDALRDKGFDGGELDTMTADLEALRQANRECDAIREQLSEKVKTVNDILAGVKEKFAEKKRIIKGYYPQEEWIKYGVQDKR